MSSGLTLESMGWNADDLRDRDALLIAGPTASGKSALAISIAKATGGVIINADSMQVYDGIRILTARPSVAEEQEAEHRLFGFVRPGIAFSSGDYVRTITPLLSQMKAEKRLAIITGGTGLYFNVLTQGLAQTPDISPEAMAEVAQMEARGENLHERLQKLDPVSAQRLAPADLPRIQRALAVVLSTGKPLGEWQAETTSPILPQGRWLGLFLAPDRATLYARINARFHGMMAADAMEEVRFIASLGLPANRGVMKAHGMPHLIAHLKGEITLERAIELGQQDTRNYAKRQMTWARRFMTDWKWVG